MTTDFLDVYLDDLIPGFPCNSSPRFSTTIVSAGSGAENRNRNWLHPLHRYQLPNAIREQGTFEAIHAHWLVCGGPELTFPFRDPLDFASIDLDLPNVPPDITGSDQLIGVGDGFNRFFQLQKTYSRPINGGGEATYTRPIYLPILDTVSLLMGPYLGVFYPPGSVPSPAGGPYTYEISRPGGVVTFGTAVQAGLEVTSGFLFDTQVRFEADDSFDGIVQSYQVSGFANLVFVETRPC